jgi:LmbE family N-acetylglucosaminyl deacetylase
MPPGPYGNSYSGSWYLCNGVPSTRTLLAVHAHPDDESITMGGTLARYSAAGVRTVVVTCTTGDLGTIFDPSLLGQDVATLRARELECAAARLGVARVVRLGYGDSGLPFHTRPNAFANVPLEVSSTRLLAVFEEEQPDIIVGYDATGGYPHADHVRAHEVAVAAYRQFARGRLYFVRFPLSWSREFVYALRAAGIDAPGSAPSGADAGPEVTEIGVPDDLVTTRVDVRAFISQKLAAIACHASQMPPDHFIRRVPIELAKRLWAHEFYSQEAGDGDFAL